MLSTRVYGELKLFGLRLDKTALLRSALLAFVFHGGRIAPNSILLVSA
jgi:hypothetical protein